MQGMIGEIRIFAGNFPPRNWAFCDGQLQSIAQNQAMFSILGTIYGGDGRTTFALPELRGRTVIGPGSGPGLPTYREGQKLGNYQTVLNSTNLPSHNHVAQVAVSTEDGEESTPTGVLAKSTSYNEDPTSGVHLGGVVTGNTGGNQPMNNQQPYLAIRYIICLYGTFPSRS